ncbi:uncharacterized protein LOC133901244 isoform X1 [Phragmites australis]|uniref:uncharacterized protein LOC133901244 isoform X1 n=1 Tax=Phragmites australis TaxID=29695 RepID=UPI002D77A570|nr:uncharacterized protein LOC133901244 isoform X1 [Phragmites australis]
MDAGDHDTSIDHDFFLQGLTGDYGPFDTSAAGDDGPDGEPPVGSHPDPGDAAGVPSSGSTSAHTLASSGSKRSRAGTSEVWQDFERIYKEEDGVSVRYAKCYICKNELSAKPSGGTGHLKRHAISCKRKSGAAMKQTVLQYNPDGSVHHWEYDSANARKELCRFIARADLPLNIAYKQYCVAMGVRPRKFALDMPVRWNSTFLMLKNIIPYKSTFGVFIHTHYHQHGVKLYSRKRIGMLLKGYWSFLNFFMIQL